AILYFDYLVMLPEEIQYMWFGTNRRTVPSYLFFITRYISLAAHIPTGLAEFGLNLGPKVQYRCSSLQLLHFYITAAIQLMTALVFIMRVNALYQSRLVLGMLVAFTVGTIGIAIWAFAVPHPGSETTHFILTVPGCNPLLRQAEALRLAITWSAVSVFDLIVFLLTLRKAIGARWQNPSALWYTFMRDGKSLYLVLSSITMLILSGLMYFPVLKGANGLLTNVMSATLVCRLIINLR
ncbi:hypothetical protein K488DRAFT_25677, partial [Vararia minispora EC-137]